MSFMSILSVTGSAMSAQDVRLNTCASNLANAESVSSSEGTTYRARKPIFAAVMAETCQNGFSNKPDAVPVQVLGIVEKTEPLKKEYSPGHPLADKNGFIYKPNVNLMQEMADMMDASRSYQVSADLANTIKELAMKTIMAGG